MKSPPWNFVEYTNDTAKTSNNEVVFSETQDIVRVVGGRDYNLLKLLGQYMNFTIEYIDPSERTQGAVVVAAADSKGDANNQNLNFSGGLGLIQRREADLLLGDVTITWERREAVEFSFFTLADSGAFATHAPKRLNEALVLVRPFRYEVWPLLLFTIAITGPAFYIIISVPFKWQTARNSPSSTTAWKPTKRRPPPIFRNPLFVYTLEMSYSIRDVEAFNQRDLQRRTWRHRSPVHKLPENLFEKCVWFTITLFLKQCTVYVFDETFCFFL